MVSRGEKASWGWIWGSQRTPNWGGRRLAWEERRKAVFSIKTASGFFLGNSSHVAEIELSVHSGYCMQPESLRGVSET